MGRTSYNKTANKIPTHTLQKTTHGRGNERSTQVHNIQQQNKKSKRSSNIAKSKIQHELQHQYHTIHTIPCILTVGSNIYARPYFQNRVKKVRLIVAIGLLFVYTKIRHVLIIWLAMTQDTIWWVIEATTPLALCIT